MIYFFTPYSFQKKLFEAYDQYMQLIPDPEDWGCLMDGDAAFLLSDFGHQIQEYIDNYPDTGLFTCYGSRCPYGHQVKPGINQASDSIRTIYENTAKMRQNDHLKVIPISKRIAGHLMVIQKKTWMTYRDEIAQHAENANIQAVDTAISDILLKHNEKILLMEGMQVFHYYRQYSMSEKHILSDKLTVVIRTHDRPAAFKRCIESVRAQSHPNIDIVVGVDTPGSMEYAETYNPTKIIKCEPRPRRSHQDFPANQYISTLISHINDGYILILDDDNYLADPKGVEKLFAQITKEYCIYIIRYRYPDGRLFPNDNQFREKRIENGGVDWASCVFHARFKDVSKSKPLYNADYHFIKALADRVNVTEFIDLALVHTDTPGNDGKTELIKNPLPSTPRVLGAQSATIALRKAGSGYTPETDVVYVLGTGSQWSDNELRFSLRSLVANVSGIRNVFVVGAKPAWLQNVIHMPATDDFNPAVNADANIINKVLKACADKRLSDNFLFINDDHLILDPIDITEVPAFHKGDMKTYGPDFWKLNYWRGRLKRTMLALLERGLTSFNFDCHTPMLMNKARFIEIMNSFNYGLDVGLTMKSLYGNSEFANSGVMLTNEKQTIFRNYSLQELDERLKDCQFMAYNDQGINKPLMYWLWRKFPEQSEFEATDIQEKIIEVSKWLDGPRNFNDGVELFRKYMKGSNLLELFEDGETPRLQKKLEYKLERIFDGIK